MSDEARKFFLDGRAVALATMPYLGGAVLAMSYAIDERVTDMNGTPTMGVTDKGQLLVHPQFLVRLASCGGPEAVGYVILHEVQHVLFKHASRAARLREKHGDKFDARASGLAMDFTINPGLTTTTKKRGKFWWIREPTGDCAGVFPQQYGLAEGLRYEDYYGLLTDPNSTCKKPSPAGDGDGDPLPGQGCAPSGKGQLSDGAEAVGDKLPEWSDARLNSILKQVAAEARKAEEKKRGTVPAGFLLDIEEALEPPKVDWKAELFSVMSDAIDHSRGGSEHSYIYTSRRQAGLGYGPGSPRLPGHIEPIPNIVVIWDTSGSMYGNLDDLVRETLAIAELLNLEVKTIACDAAVNQVANIGNLADAKAALKGGGGTCMTPAMLEAKKHSPSLVVCITDGMIETQPTEGYGFQVLWVLVADYTEAIKPSLTHGWGRYILIEEDKS